MQVLETDRLTLHHLSTLDAEFTIELMNSPGWLEFIGDRGVKFEEAARNYLISGPIKSYRMYGYGMYLVRLKEDETRIGMCGLVNRPGLENVDIGFALLPGYEGKGYGYESAKAVLEYAFDELDFQRIVAITEQNNLKSIRLLEKIGLSFKDKIIFNEEEVMLFSLDKKKCLIY